ncbi:MAG: class I SAM-dependent methyltransferase [Bacteroidetes bacterium]|nr:class I SAM-dependent methyltransferase [Bacteroidota bacterium]
MEESKQTGINLDSLVQEEQTVINEIPKKPVSKSIAEQKLSTHYNNVGWDIIDPVEGITMDAIMYEDLRKNAKDYVIKCRKRVQHHIPEHGDKFLDMGCGAIQFKEYADYSKNFAKRYCVDLSKKGLEEAKKRIGNHGVFLCGNFLDIDLEEDYFDCSVSLHAVYHIEKERQAEAVRKLIAVTKPQHKIIIVYSNPKSYMYYLKLPYHALKNIALILHLLKKNTEEADLYYYVYPIKWWKQFNDIATIKILPWRSFRSSDQKRIIPDNKIGRIVLDKLYRLEDRFPRFFVKFFEYPMIILTKK